MDRRRVVSLAVVAVAVGTMMVSGSTSPQIPELPSNSTDEPLVVDRASEYCDWTRALGPVCIYNTTKQMVVVPEGLQFSSGQLELEIHEAQVVNLHPTCVSWIQIFNAGMIHTLPPENNDDLCRTWLRVYDSKMGRVEHGVKDLTLLDSEVEAIKLTNQRDFMAINSSIGVIEELDWGGYRATVLNTTIWRVIGMQARDRLHVVGSRFGSIATGGIVFNAREMSVVNSTFRHLSFQSLTILSGAVSFANVTINYLEASAIRVTSPSGFLSLSNITIGAANAPCFVVLDRERLSLRNVTVLGIPINESSPFIDFLDDDAAKETDYETPIGREQCEPHATDRLNCEYASPQKGLEIKGKNIYKYRVVKVRNAASLLVSSTGCQTQLQLENVNVTLPHVTVMQETGSADTDNSNSNTGSTNTGINSSSNNSTCNVTISATNSSINILWVKYINGFSATGSTIKRIHGGSLESFNLENSSVEEMDEVEVTGRGAVWNKSLLLGHISLTLRAPLVSSDINLPHIMLSENSLIIDHPGQTTKLSGWRLGWMQRQSIIVKNGSHLELNDIVAVRGAQEAIYLEEGASASSKLFRILQESVYIFSVASKDQVQRIESSQGSHLPSFLVHVRGPSRTVDHQNNFTVTDTHTSPYCHTIPYFLQICDFTSAPKEEVTVDFANGQVVNRVVVKGASSVMLFPSCVEKIILMNVEKASTAESERECGTWLEAFGVHLSNVTSGVHDVTLKSCKVDLLAPNRRLRDVDLEGTEVERVVGVHWAGYTGVFNNSRLGEVKSLRADSRLMMSNSTVNTLDDGGMFLAAEAIIVNTTFKKIKKDGMTVNGSTRLQDVIIEKVEAGGIKVLDGLLLLVNVKIMEAEVESITAGMNGGISFQNVTVGGKKVHWLGYLTTKDSLNNSVIFLNKHVESDTTKIQPSLHTTTTTTTTSFTITTSTTTTEDTDQTPQTSKVQGKESEMDSSMTPDILAAHASMSWKWAGAGIGFCMGLLVGCCIFIVIKVIKPNKGLLTLPTVFWRVKEDQHELLQDEQAIEEPTVNQDQGYSPLPHSDTL